MLLISNGRRPTVSGRLPKQTVLSMKLTAILLFIGCLQLSAKSFSQNINLSAKNMSLEKALSIIGNQSGHFFFYRYNDLRKAKSVTLDLKNTPLKQALEEAFRNQPFTYTIDNKTIVVNKKTETPVAPKPELAPLADVKGKVLNEKNEPLPGATIRVKGANKMTVSDADGVFSLTGVPDDAVIVVSYTGYIQKEFTAASAADIVVVLKEEDSNLKAVVVVGYGTQQRKDVTGSIATISSQKLKDQVVTTIDAAMAGLAAGVQVSQASGSPGGGVSVRVRGAGSVTAGNEPLYVIDGFPVTNDYNQLNNPLNTISPNDIESIQILKDASATAIYGSRGSNGVVIITTKSGKSGVSRINFDAYTGIQEVAKKIELLDAEGFGKYINETRNNGWIDRGGSASDPNSVRNNALYNIPAFTADPSTMGKGTDWQDEIFRSAPMRNYQLSFSGGNEKTKYYISGGYLGQDGVVIGSDFKRYSFKLNIESELSKRIKVGANITPSYTTSNVSDAEGHWTTGAVILSALLIPPHLPVYNPDGTYTTARALGNGFSSVENPVKVALEKVNKFNRFRLLGTSFAEIELYRDLKFKTMVGVDLASSRNRTFIPSVIGRDGAAPPQIPSGSATSTENVNWLTELTLNYNKRFGAHAVNAVVGYTAQQEEFQSNMVSATNFPNDLVQTINAGVVNGGSSDIQQWTLLSYLARANYSYDNKYLLTATIRRDGSSRFGADNKWGVFPSVSLGWRISQEDFMQNIAWLSELKLRTSYGVTGNNFIGNYEHIGLMTGQNYIFGSGSGAIVNGVRPSTFANANLGWERNNQFDAGVEIGVFDNRIALAVDYYDKRTSDLLLDVQTPLVTGFPNATQNIGKVKNHGFEFTLNTKNLVNAFKWSTDFNISFNKNEVLELGPGGAPVYASYQINNSHITQIGGELGAFFGYDVIGVFQNQKEIDENPSFADSKPGHLRFRDVDGDGKLSTADRTVLGSSLPDFTWGLTNSFSYNNFDLSVMVQGVQGFEIMNLGRRFYSNYAGTGNSLAASYENAWRSEADPGDGKTPRLNRDLARYTSSNASANISSVFIEDGSFWRIRNIALGYTFSEKLVSKIGAKSIRFYGSVQNAFTKTDYIGYNPEISNVGSSATAPGVDYGGYPVARTFTFGFNLGF